MLMVGVDESFAWQTGVRSRSRFTTTAPVALPQPWRRRAILSIYQTDLRSQISTAYTRKVHKSTCLVDEKPCGARPIVLMCSFPRRGASVLPFSERRGDMKSWPGPDVR